MKSVLFSTDFVRRSDGTLTPVEINTNTSHSMKISHPLTVENFEENLDGFMDYEGLNNFMIQNSLSKLIIIDSWSKFGDIFKIFCEKYGFEYESIILEKNSINVPDIQELENELVIRIAYDSYSLFDDLYARDMYEFHNLIKNESFASPVAFQPQEDLDTITSLEASVDGVAPNYVLKPRYPSYTGPEYPKLYRFENKDDLDNLKLNLTSNEFIQKYEINKTYVEDNGNTVYFYRSIDLLISSTFDTVNVFTYKGFNSVRVDNESIRYENEIDSNFRMNDGMGIKYYPLWFTRKNFLFHFDDTDEVLLPNDGLLNANEIKVGDTLKSLKFDNPSIKNGGYSNTPFSIEELNNFTLVESNVVMQSENPQKNLFINIKATNSEYGNFEWFDGWSNPYLITKQGTDLVSFKSEKIGDIEVGDIVYVYNKSASSLIPLTVTEVFFEIKEDKTYLITLSDSPLFFVKLENTSNSEEIGNWFLLQHNFNCYPDCYNGNPLGYNCYTFGCLGCGKYSPGCFNCGGSAFGSCP
jgi:hypothetical protein